MPLLHEFGMKLGDQWEDGVHVLNSLVQSLECFPSFDLFVLWALRIALLCLHVLDQGRQLLGINLIPQSRGPCSKLVVNEGNQIPHLLEVEKLVSAILELLVGGLLHIEERLQVVELTGFLLELTSPGIVLANCLVSVADDLW